MACTKASGDCYQPLMPPGSCDLGGLFLGEWSSPSPPTPSLSFCMAQIRVGLISVKLLIRPISRHAAKRLDLTGQAWVSTETTDLQPKLWIGNVPKHGAASWMESSLLHDDTRSMTRRKPLYFFTHLPRDAVIVFRGGFSVCLFYWFNFLATRCWWKFWLLT